MFKKLTVLSFLMVLGFSVFSQEKNGTADTSFSPGRFSLGLNYVFGPKLNWAVGTEFGFRIFSKNTLDIRNHIVFNSYFITDDDGIENATQNLSDKLIISVGGDYWLVRPFSFSEVGIGFFSNDSKKFWTTPLAYFIGLGLGFELFATRYWSYTLDTGVVWQFLGGNIFPFQRFSMGTKFYF